MQPINMMVINGWLSTDYVVNDFNSEALVIEIDLNNPAQCVIRVLDRIVENRGYPLKKRIWTTDRNWSKWGWLNGL
ncbi:hypothetical protein [Pantoea sp. paga]|uniref:hypothetical protein n=1 Tax=Pantoea sp. paga TaxID=2597519 RepID=UPI00351ABB12